MNKINFREEERHGTPYFPFQAFSQKDTCGQYFAPYHWHDEVEFLYVTEGSLLLHTETDYPIPLKAGHVYFINPGTVHGIFGDSPISHHYALLFPLEFLSFARYDICQNEFLSPFFPASCSFLWATNFLPPAHLLSDNIWRKPLLLPGTRTLSPGLYL